ncbi:MAG: hypothetical protein RLY16_2965 [Bacteroidota bacterium]
MKNKQQILLLIVLYLLQHLPLKAQLQTLQFSHLTVNENLSQSVNNCIYKDSRGYVWISSYEGLNRFDGTNCKVFRHEAFNPTSIRGTLFLNIMEDKAANLWIGSNDGLVMYQRKEDRFYTYYFSGNGNSSTKIYSPFYIDDLQQIWVQSGTQILTFQPATKQFTFRYNIDQANQIIFAPVYANLYEPLKYIFGAIKNGSAIFKLQIQGTRIDSTQIQLPKKLGSAGITGLVCKDQQCYIGTDAGLIVYNQKSFSRFGEGSKMGNYFITAIAFDQQQRLWLGTQRDGLIVADRKNELVLTTYKADPFRTASLSGNQIQYIYLDDENNLWAAIWGQGIDYANLNQFKFTHVFSRQEAASFKSDNFIRSIIETSKEDLWCATQNNGILRFDKQYNFQGKLNVAIPNSIEHIAKDNKDGIWISTLAGLYYMNIKDQKPFRVNESVSKENVAAAQYNFTFCLRNGKVLASSNNGLKWIEGNGKKYISKPVAGIYNGDVYLTSYEDESGNIYVSRAFKGFAKYRLEGDSFVLIKAFPSQSSIKCFSKADPENIWIGTTNGLFQLNITNNKISHYLNTTNGLANQYVYGILPHESSLWISTNAGISAIQLQPLSITNFQLNDGLQSKEFNTYAFCKRASGAFVFGGVNGMNFFIPAKVKPFKHDPPIQLEYVQINDAPYQSGINPGELQALSLDYAQNTISVGFAILDYVDPAGNNLRYMLSGYDKNWIEVPNKTKIRYGNLPPGNYTLLVQSVSGDKIISNHIYRLKIMIKTPWFLSWYFFVGVTVLALIIATLIIRFFYQRELQKQLMIREKEQAIEKERTRIATDMHDDFGANLSRIKFISEKMQIKAKGDANIQQDLNKISNYSDEMAEKMGEIVWALNQRHDSLEDLVSFCRSYASEYLQDKNIRLYFESQLTANPKIHGEIRRNIFLAVKESIHNIVKHANASEVSIQFQQSELLVVTLKDNGVGINLQQIRPFANGLENMKKRMADIGGTFEIEKMEGTRITLTVPI